MRLRVEYSDQNESFARYLPRVGQTTRSFTSDAGTPGWFLFELDEPFEYQLKVGEAFRFREIVVTHFLLRSRWAGYDIGSATPTSVFLLLVEEGAVPLKGPIHVEDYVQIAWGMCTREKGGV
jgi:hypothetical protein